MQISEIIEYIDQLKNAINQYTQALISLRGRHWEKDIDKDERPAVKNIDHLRRTTESELGMILDKEIAISIKRII